MVRESEHSGWVGIQPESTLSLNRTVEVPAGASWVYFHRGRLARTSGGYQPSCALQVRTDATTAQQVTPARFRIIRVQAYRAEVAARDNAPVLQLANHGDGGYSMIQNGFHFWLDNSANPAVVKLTCLGRLDEPPKAFPPTLVDIRAALGNWITLNLDTKPILQ